MKGRKQKCRLIFHGSYKEHDMGEFESIAKAKRYMRSCWNDRPYTIRIIKEETGNVKEGDTIEFYVSCNANRKLFTGVVQYKEQLGLITIVDGVQYEIKKLVDIKVLNLI